MFYRKLQKHSCWLVLLFSGLATDLAAGLVSAEQKADALSGEHKAFVKQVVNAKKERQPMPHVSLIKQKTSVQQAYQIQQSIVNLRQVDETIAGYKAGLTSQAGQAKFKVNSALSGVLFSSGLIHNNLTIQRSNAVQLMLETELGFVVSTPINQRITDIEQLKKAFTKVAAVIELPDLGFQQMQAIRGVDLIAANLASHQFIVGNKVAIADLNDIDKITTRLSFNQQQLFSGKATDAMQGQWQALLWLVNHLIDQGYQLSVGEVLITGALGKMVPAKVGNYIAEFGPLGKIEFKIN